MPIIWRDGCFVITQKVGPVVFILKALEEVRTQRGVRVARAAAMACAAFESKTERQIGDMLSGAGLPWDLVWLERRDDAVHGKVGTINLSPRTLNEWLARQPWFGATALKLKAVEVDAGGFTFELTLQPRAT
ncbi:MAG: hypothetical protein HYU66_00275 [Armatimonadetes bacterium]|nr:hypothetical protein [Armatimonadota bacterium]